MFGGLPKCSTMNRLCYVFDHLTKCARRTQNGCAAGSPACRLLLITQLQWLQCVEMLLQLAYCISFAKVLSSCNTSLPNCSQFVCLHDDSKDLIPCGTGDRRARGVTCTLSTSFSDHRQPQSDQEQVVVAQVHVVVQLCKYRSCSHTHESLSSFASCCMN
jgi:hypothetical protein